MKTLVSTLADPEGQGSGDSLRLGTQAGPWVIERELGRGGMGVVYEVRHAQIGKRAALKVMRHASHRMDSTASRMQLEAQVVNAIRHPNIVDIFDVGATDDGRPYIVMELLTGSSLRDCEPEGSGKLRAVPLADAIEILRQVSGALIAAHAAGVVHRDLKPENIFVTTAIGGLLRVVVLDWGIARMLDANVHYTLEGQLVGTPRYIAPEQARGEPVTPKTDVYALGVVAYELVLSRLPFDAESGAELMAMHLLMPVPAPRTLWPEIPPALGSLLEQMLSKRPEDRPTMTEVEARLGEIASELPDLGATSEPPEVEAVDDVAIPRRRSRRWIAVALGALTLAAIVGVRHASRSPTVATTRPDVPAVTQSRASSVPTRPVAVSALSNPVLEDCSDPAILRQASRWYMTCTGGHAGNLYPIYESSDLQTWHRVSWIFPAGNAPAWASGNYWSPELHPTPDGIAAYFSMRVAGGRNAIGVATAKTITGPYTDLGTPLISPRHGASDAHVLVDGDRRYLYFKDEARPASIVVQPLAADGLGVEGEATRVLSPTQPWEHENVEAPWVVRVGGYYYLFYTGSRYCDLTYAVGVARAKTPLGPFEKPPAPLVVGDREWLAPGHTTVTEGPAGALYLLHHAYRASEGEPSCDDTTEHNTRRHAKIDRLRFENGWPILSAPM